MWKDINKIVLKEIGREDVNWTHMAHDMDQ
jgi:hypothetical protein